MLFTVQKNTELIFTYITYMVQKNTKHNTKLTYNLYNKRVFYTYSE